MSARNEKAPRKKKNTYMNDVDVHNKREVNCPSLRHVSLNKLQFETRIVKHS